MKRIQFFILFGLLILILLWVILPAQWTTQENWLITVQAANSGALIWFGVACAISGILFFLAALSLRNLYAWRHIQALTVLRQYGNEGLVLCDQKGKVRWSNEAGFNLLLEGGRLRDEAQSVFSRALATRKVSLQGIVIGERARVNVQAIPITGDVALIARQAQNDGGQAQFYERFMRRIVHDMRNPLAAIIAHASNLRASAVLDTHAAEIIENEALRLTRLVDSLLFDARLTYVPLSAEQLDPVELLEEVIYQFEERAAAEDKTLTLETPPDRIQIEGDHDLLVRAIGNLLDNSLKYSHAGNSVRVILQHTPEQIQITVIDTGDGIPAEYLPERIFDPLVRAHTKDRTSGSGLGLSIVKKIVEMHGGRIAAESEPGKGTRITIWLPR